MLGKLIKYELRATGRTFGLVYGVLLLFAALNRVFLALNSENPYIQFISGFIMIAYVLGIVAMIAVTLFIALSRFYRNLLGDEGYLMFTLPAKPWMLITSKLFAGVLWSLASVMCTITSVVIVAATPQLWSDFLRGMQMLWEELGAIIDSGLTAILIEVIILAVVSVAVSLLQFYLSMAVGQLSNRHRLAASAGAYIAINIILQIVMTVILVSAGIYVNTFGFGPFANLMQASTLQLILLLMILWNGAFGALFFAGTNYMLTRRLNLE